MGGPNEGGGGACMYMYVSPGVRAETLYHRDDALLYIAYVMLIWAESRMDYRVSSSL